MARGHTKSRYGCRECKQRHIKCDESKPSCVNCVTIKRTCSFLSQVSTTVASLPGRTSSSYTASAAATTSQSPLMPTPPRQQRHDGPLQEAQDQRAPQHGNTTHPSFPEDPQITHHHVQSSSTPSLSPPQTALTLPDSHFTITHLSLLHHYSHTLCPILLSQNPKAEPMLSSLLQEAFTAPFLMDQVLSIAAAHRSTSSQCSHDSAAAGGENWVVEATKLQQRSLRKFRAGIIDTGRADRGGATAGNNGDEKGLVERRPLAVLGFSMLVSHSALFFACAIARGLWDQHHGVDYIREHPRGKGEGRGEGEQVRNGRMTFAAVLDELDTCLVVHQGMADVARQALPLVESEVKRRLFAFAEGKTDLVNGRVGRARAAEENAGEGGEGAGSGVYPSPSESSASELSWMDIDSHGVGGSVSGAIGYLEPFPPEQLLRELFPDPIPPQSSSASTPSTTASTHSHDLPFHAEVYQKTLTALLAEYHDASIPSPVNLSTPKAQRYLSAMQHFLVRTPAEYRDLLAQRRPEALVLLAYYAVLVHRGGENWAVGPVAGRCLVEGTVESLGGMGGYWGRWLGWCAGQVDENAELCGNNSNIQCI